MCPLFKKLFDISTVRLNIACHSQPNHNHLISDLNLVIQPWRAVKPKLPTCPKSPRTLCPCSQPTNSPPSSSSWPSSSPCCWASGRRCSPRSSCRTRPPRPPSRRSRCRATRVASQILWVRTRRTSWRTIRFWRARLIIVIWRLGAGRAVLLSSPR